MVAIAHDDAVLFWLQQNCSDHILQMDCAVCRSGHMAIGRKRAQIAEPRLKRWKAHSAKATDKEMWNALR